MTRSTPTPQHIPIDPSYGHLLGGLAHHREGILGPKIAEFLHRNRTPVGNPDGCGWSTASTCRELAWMRACGYPVIQGKDKLWRLGEPASKATAAAMFACLALAHYDTREPLA